MKSRITKSCIALCSTIIVACATESPYTQAVDGYKIDERTQFIVDSVYNKMSNEERLAQIQGIRTRDLIVDGELSLELCREKIPNGIGHFSQYACMLDLEPDKLLQLVKDLQNYLINETPSGVPAIFHEEAITGLAARGATTYPQQLGMSSTWNPELMRLKTQYTAESMREAGSFMALSPNLDIIRTAVFNRGEEALGEDSYLTSRLGVAFVDGLQGDDLKSGVAACAKHYLGYGGGSENEEKVIYEEILMPYDAVVRMATCKNVMTAYHQVDDIYCVFNKNIITDILRGYLQFDGVLVSDYGAIGQTGANPDQSEQDLIQRAANAINAGCDMEFSEGVCFPLIPKAIEQGLITEADFERAVKRTLTLKAELGIFDPSTPLYLAEGDIDMNKPKYVELAYEAAAQSVVLIKNNGVLPLTNKSGKIGLVGPNANSPWAMLGDYTYQSMHYFHQGPNVTFDSPKIYTLKESMESRLEGATLNYQRGCDWNMSNEAYLNLKSGEDSRFVREKVRNLQINLYESVKDETNWDKALELSKDCDVIIAAVGENVALCGEGRGRKGIGLPGRQEELVQAMIDSGKLVILVVFGGRLQVLEQKTLDGVAAIVQAWYPGQEGGNAVADILYGDVNPSGKLSTTYSNRHDVVDVCYNRADEGAEAALYPFGYGLSYTTYEYSNIEMPSSAKISDREFEISFTLTNSGDMAGDEIAQLYVSPANSDMPFKAIQLKGFDRVSLEAGESKRVTFSISPRLLSYYENGEWVLAPGKFIFKIGASSADIKLSGELELKGERFISRNRDVYFSENR